MSLDERAHQAWPTWPRPGIPVSPEAWRRGAVRGHSLVRSAGVVAVAFVASRLLGLLREVILAHQFGTSGVKSAYVVAFQIPDLLFLIIMAGSFGSAFIPVFAGFLATGREAEAWRLTSAVLTLAAVALLVAGLVVLVFAGPVVGLLAPGLGAEHQQLATDLTRLLLLSPLFLGLGIAAKGILEGQDRFDLPAFAPVVYNLAIILGALLLAPRVGIFGVAVGVVAGAIGHLAVQVPGLVRSGLRYRPTFDLSTPGLAEVGRLLGPRLVGQAAFQINFVVVYSLASRIGEQEIAALNFAWQLLMLPHGVIALSISTVVFPTMSRLFQQGRFGELRVMFGRALRPLLFLSLPAAVILFFFRTAIVQTVLQWGVFSATSTALVAEPLAWFALGLVAYAVTEVLTRAFYAMHDTRTPVAAGVATIILNIALATLLVDRFGHAALALSLGLTTAIEAAVLLAVLRRRLGRAAPKDLRWLGRVLAATAAMSVVAWAVAPRVSAATEPGLAPRPLQVLLFAYALAVTGLSYLLAAHLLRLPEVTQALALTKRFPGFDRLSHLLGRRRRARSWR